MEAPGAIPRLRRFILDLAGRGKLVEQDPNDEPASELMKRIRAQSSADTKQRGMTVLPVRVSERLFEVPRNWEWVRFGTLAAFSAGRTPSRHDSSLWNTGDYPWVSIADMDGGGVVLATKETISEKAKQRIFRSEPLAAGTLIMSFKLTIGKISLLGVPAFHNEAIISIRPYVREMDAYLFKVLPQFAREGDLKDAIKGRTLNREPIANLLIPLPPLSEQQRILAKITELMVLCETPRGGAGGAGAPARSRRRGVSQQDGTGGWAGF